LPELISRLARLHGFAFVAFEVVILSAAPIRACIESSLNERLLATLLLRERVLPQTVTTGIRELDGLTGGLPRGALAEIVGPVSSGRTGVMISALAAATCRQEACALVDASDSFNPVSAEAAGVALKRLLWIRCSEQASGTRTYDRDFRKQRKALRRLDQVLKVTDLLLQSGGFGMVVLDLGNLPQESVRRVPLTSWFRFRRAVEQTTTVLLLIEQAASAQTCASLVVQLRREAICAGNPTKPIQSDNVGWRVVSNSQAVPPNNTVSHASLLQGMHLQAEVVRSWTRKSIRPAHARFELTAKYLIA
jgi:hypothetical protein